MLRIAVIGVGSIGSRHIDTLLAMGYQDLVGLDFREMPNEDRLPIVSRWDELEAWNPTHALICTPPEEHYKYALDCLRAGMHTFIEKPMADGPTSCRDLIRAAKKDRLKLAVGYMERANPTVLEAMAFAQAHHITNAYIECHWKMKTKTYRQWAIAESSHAIDTAQFIAGEPLTVVNWRGDDIRTELECVTKRQSAFYITMHADSLPMRRINLYAQGGAFFGRQYGLTREEWEQCYRDELKAFLEGEPLCTGEDGLRVVEILEAVK